MNLFDTTYIISAELSDLTDAENFERTNALESKLKLWDVAFKRSLGCFKNRREVNFVVITDENTAIDLLREFKQDSALVLDSRRNAYLLDATGATKSIGKFKAVPEDIALRNDGWTFDKVTNQYFIVE
jgi:hypothetical protein